MTLLDEGEAIWRTRISQMQKIIAGNYVAGNYVAGNYVTETYSEDVAQD